MIGLVDFTILKYKNLSNKYLRILPMTLLGTMGIGTIHTGIKLSSIKTLTRSEYIYNSMKDTVKSAKTIKTDAFALPKDGKPISKYDDKDEAYTEVVSAIRKLIDSFEEN